MYSLSLDKWIHLYLHHPNQNIGHFHPPAKLCHACLQSTSPASTPHDHRAAFYNYRSLLLIIESHVSEIIQCVFFCVWLF